MSMKKMMMGGTVVFGCKSEPVWVRLVSPDMLTTPNPYVCVILKYHMWRALRNQELQLGGQPPGAASCLAMLVPLTAHTL